MKRLLISFLVITAGCLIAFYQTEPFDIYGEGPTHFKKEDGSHIVPAEKIMKELNGKWFKQV